MKSKTLILIPSRMGATRLPGKPLLKQNNLWIISHVVKKKKKTNIGRVVVCTENREILEEVEKNGGEAILTNSNHKTGTDRIFEGFKKLNIENIENVINLQGDEPTIDERDIINLNRLMIESNSGIGSLASKIKSINDLSNNDIVKVKLNEKLDKNNFPIAIDFKRTILKNKNSNIYNHIGIYAYKVKVLEKFINLSQTKNEIVNRLEQLRALDNNMNINIALAKTPSIGIDTKEDYVALKKIMEYKS